MAQLWTLCKIMTLNFPPRRSRHPESTLLRAAASFELSRVKIWKTVQSQFD